MGNSTSITLQQFEDFCLGFQQESTKLFVFGKFEESIAPEMNKAKQLNP
jgi:hypothetical protein